MEHAIVQQAGAGRAEQQAEVDPAQCRAFRCEPTGFKGPDGGRGPEAKCREPRRGRRYIGVLALKSDHFEWSCFAKRFYIQLGRSKLRRQESEDKTRKSADLSEENREGRSDFRALQLLKN